MFQREQLFAESVQACVVSRKYGRVKPGNENSWSSVDGRKRWENATLDLKIVCVFKKRKTEVSENSLVCSGLLMMYGRCISQNGN